MEKVKFKPAQQEIAEGKAECYWCDKIYPIEEMVEDRQHGVKVYNCKGCNQS